MRCAIKSRFEHNVGEMNRSEADVDAFGAAEWSERRNDAFFDFALRELQRSDRDDDQHQQHAAYGNGPALALRHRHACLLVAALYTAWH
jgi:hypothetical protein